MTGVFLQWRPCSGAAVPLETVPAAAPFRPSTYFTMFCGLLIDWIYSWLYSSSHNQCAPLCCDSFSVMDEVSSEASHLSRPSAKSIYCKLTLLQRLDQLCYCFKPVNNTDLWFVVTVQRKEYAALINQTMDKSQYRLEVFYAVSSRKIRPFADDTQFMLCFCSTLLQHLFTCELDGKDLKSVADCVERLKLLEETGRLWGQNMLLEVHGTRLLLTDMETKVNNTYRPWAEIWIWWEWWWITH